MSARRGVAVVLFLIFLAMMASAAGLLILALMFGGGQTAPVVASNSTLFLRVQAPFPEIDSSSVFSGFIATPPTLRTVLAVIEKAKHDDRIRGMVVIPSTNGALWAQVQEVRDAMAAFRASGKSLVVFMEYGGAADYYLASAAERVLMMPAGSLDVSGLATYEVFLRGAFDKLGIYPDLLHMGEFKSASNTFTERGFTPAHREMTRSLNRDAYDQLVSAIAAGRKRSVDEIRRALDQGPFLPEEAKAAGLIDDLAYDDQIDDASPVQGTRRLEGDDYTRGFIASTGSGPRVALLYGVGTIASGRSSFDGPTGAVLGSDTFVEWIRKVRADSSIKAIVIRIDSPGGSAIASEVIWRELMLTRQVKPIIVSMGNVAASGGYYMAVPATAIVAQPGTITGSIGVVTGKYVLKGAFDKLGIGTDSVSDGKNAEIYSPFRAFTPEERAKVEGQMQATYDLFVSRVAEGRRSSPDKIDAIAKGRVWTGQQAHELGLVDELGGLDRAIALAKEHAKLDAAKPVTLVIYPQKRSFADLVANPLGLSLGASLELAFRRPEARLVDGVADRLRLFRRGETLALMPNLFFNQGR
ncbi:MAG: signal peptide peptidase SppA [Acidobacteria bacterium]|nr:signal peptide peptidase SppA [Acidobacteriota bacterium]